MAHDVLKLSEYPRYIQGTIEMVLKDPSTIIQSDLETIAEEIISVGCQKDTLQSAIELTIKLCDMDTQQGHSSRFVPCMRNALTSCFQRRNIIRRNHVNWMRLLKFTLSVYTGVYDSAADCDLSDMMLEALQSTVQDFDEEEKCDEQSQIPHPSEVDFLIFTLQDHGKNLEESDSQKTEALFDLIRDHIIKEGTEATVRQMLMEILEFRAFGWTLPEQVTSYYYGS